MKGSVTGQPPPLPNSSTNRLKRANQVHTCRVQQLHRNSKMLDVRTRNTVYCIRDNEKRAPDCWACADVFIWLIEALNMNEIAMILSAFENRLIASLV